MNKDLIDFLEVEVDASTKELLLKTIEELNHNSVEFKELTFNMYDVGLYPKRNEVKLTFIVSDDEVPGGYFTVR